MYIIVVYDVNVERVNTINKFLKKYLHWRQNSVFEGEISKSQLEIIKSELKKLIDENEDSIYIYITPSKKFINLSIIGIEKSPSENII